MYSALAFTCASFTVTPNEFQEFQPIGGRSARLVAAAAAGAAMAAAATRPRRPRCRSHEALPPETPGADASTVARLRRRGPGRDDRPERLQERRVSSGVPIVTRSQVGHGCEPAAHADSARPRRPRSPASRPRPSSIITKFVSEGMMRRPSRASSATSQRRVPLSLSRWRATRPSSARLASRRGEDRRVRVAPGGLRAQRLGVRLRGHRVAEPHARHPVDLRERARHDHVRETLDHLDRGAVGRGLDEVVVRLVHEDRGGRRDLGEEGEELVAASRSCPSGCSGCRRRRGPARASQAAGHRREVVTEIRRRAAPSPAPPSSTFA